MELASRGSRLGAAAIDGVIGVVPYALTIVESLPMPVRFLGVAGLFALVGYQIYSVTTRGQTIGKRLLAIRVVVKETGVNGGFVINVLRRGVVTGLLNFIPGFFLVDSLFIFREDRRCIHDFIAGTAVIVGQPD
ncbi:MAG: RDD family protein [Elusimicrobiota bacterium]|nr:RDD family protein [Elusimicrobiota bacterium]